MIGSGSNFSSFSKSYSLGEADQKALLIARDKFVVDNAGGVVFGDGSTAFPTTAEALIDKPLAYLPSSTPKLIQDVLSLQAPPAENGLYFFNAKRLTDAADPVASGLVTTSPFQPVPWGQPYRGRPGQATQLYDRITEVLDAFYTPQGIAWRTTASAVIDLVGYSQGGLTIRAMIDQLQRHPGDLDGNGHPYREVLDHVNRIVTTDSPHFGSALVTNPTRLTNGVNHPQSAEPLQFPVLGREVLNLTDQNPGVPILEVHDLDAISIAGWDDVGLDMKVNGASYLGPYTQEAGDLKVFGWDTDNCSWYEWIIGGATCMKTFTYHLDLTPMWDALGVQTGFLKTKLKRMRDNAGATLSWSDATDASGNPTGTLIRKALTFDYPRYSNGNKIDMVTLHSASSGALMTALPDKIEQAMYQPCVDQLYDQLSFGESLITDVDATCARMSDKFSEGLALRNFAADFDADWSTRSDFVVEDFSQKGTLASGDFNPNSNPNFKNTPFTRKELIHVDVPFLEDSPKLAAHNQGCDVLTALGGTCSGGSGSGLAMAFSVAEKDNFSLAPERLDAIEAKQITPRGAANYKVRLRYKRKAPGVLNDVNLIYYFKEDPANAPTVTVTAGSWTASLRHVQDALYAVDLSATGLGLAQGQTSAEVELNFVNGNGRSWNPVDDWSSSLSTNWHPTRRIAFSTRSGESIGLQPSTATSRVTSIKLQARALSKERSVDAFESQPSLSVSNTGFGIINGFKLWYVVRSTPSLQLRQYWRTGQDQSTIVTKSMGQGYYVVEVSYPNWVLKPGDRIDDITFELNHTDWSGWNLLDDPSYRSDNPQNLVANSKIMVFDMGGNLIGGEDLSSLWETAADRQTAHVEARNSSTYPDYKVLDFRVRNDGALPIYGLEIRYRMLTEDGKVPQVHFVNTQGCVTQVFDEANGRYEATIKCPTASLEAGQVWPQLVGDAGLRMEIQYGAGAPVDLTNDPSFTGIGASWGMAAGVLLYDSEGDVITTGATWVPPVTTTTWTANTAYAVGSQVIYQGVFYQCLQAHTSQTGWEPPAVPALWSRMAGAASLSSPWQTADVGSTGVTGSAWSNGSAFTVNGSGADVWGSADAFRYVYQPMTGDMEIKARVTGVQNTNSWAKAGVMIRETLASGSKQAFMLISAASGASFQRRLATGGSSSGTNVSGAAPKWVRLIRSGNTITAYISDNGSSWTQAGSDVFSMSGAVYVGLAVSAHNSAAICQAGFDNVTVGKFVPWTRVDIGAVGVAGSTTISDAGGNLAGSGADVYGTADAFSYLYRPLNGDGSVTARVASVQNTNAWAKAGVMIRESLTAGSAQAFMLVSPTSGLAFQRRTATGGSSSSTGATGAAPKWVRLTRAGNVITAFQSSDGTSWTQVGSATFTMGSNVYVGLAVTSHSNSTLCTASFDNIALQ